MIKPSHNNENLPWLGRVLSWVDRPNSLSVIIKILVAICALLFLADFTYKKYGHFEFETYYGIYGLIGFVAFFVIVVAAKYLRYLIGRPENYYAPNSVDSEEMPSDQIEVDDAN